MKIGVDFDGVILDTERYLKYYADYYSYFELGGKLRKKDNILDQEKCFGWSKSETQYFYEYYYYIASKNAPFIPGAVEIIKKLQEEGHEIYLVTARQVSYYDETILAKYRLDKAKLKLSGYHYAVKDKGAKCEELGIELMVDDSPKNMKTFLNKNVKALYFKDVRISNVYGKNIKKVDTWMDIYLEVQKLMKEK